MEERQCAICGTTYGIEIHHIVPKILGGTDDPSNLEPLCSGCHKKKHLENRSELTKIGIAKARHQPSKNEQRVMRMYEWMSERIEPGFSPSEVAALYNEGIRKYLL